MNELNTSIIEHGTAAGFPIWLIVLLLLSPILVPKLFDYFEKGLRHLRIIKTKSIQERFNNIEAQITQIVTYHQDKVNTQYLEERLAHHASERNELLQQQADERNALLKEITDRIEEIQANSRMLEEASNKKLELIVDTTERLKKEFQNSLRLTNRSVKATLKNNKDYVEELSSQNDHKIENLSIKLKSEVSGLQLMIWLTRILDTNKVSVTQDVALQTAFEKYTQSGGNSLCCDLYTEYKLLRDNGTIELTRD